MPECVGGRGIGVEVGSTGGLCRRGELGEHITQGEDESVDEFGLVR